MTDRELPRRSLLDAGLLPVAQLAQIARRESVRPRDTYQAHKWFARRLTTTARSLLAAAVTDREGDFWKAYYGGASCEGMTILDPFMGGGVMVLEASRMGADVFGADVEPVAAAISDFQGRLRDLPYLGPWVERLSASVGGRMAPFYRSLDEDGNEETLLHAFWVQEVPCGNCGHVFDAHPSFRLAWLENEKRQWVVCGRCSSVLEALAGRARVTCGCGASTKIEAGHVVGGKGRCPSCGHSEALIALSDRTGAPPKFRIFAVETLPGGEEVRYPNTARRIRTATARDREIYEEAEAQLAKEIEADPGFVIHAVIPEKNRFDDRLLRYGYRGYGELFNARQSLHLGLLAREIAAIDGLAGEALRIAFSDHLATNNRLCAYAGGWRRLTPLFSIRAYRHIARPVELNPWLMRNGRGTFPNAVRSVMRAAASVMSTQEQNESGEWVDVARQEPGLWDIRCRDARDLAHIPDASVDLVLTDPPYCDYIAYSELGHFFVPWMARLGLIRSSKKLAAFPAGQLASRRNTKGQADAFAKALAVRLREVVRVCKPSARIVFTYQSKDRKGWLALGQALAAAGIRPLKAWPMFSDAGDGPHKHPNSISWDCVLHCDLGPVPDRFEISDTAAESGTAFAEEWRVRLAAAGYGLTKGDEANLYYGGALVAALNAATGTERRARARSRRSSLCKDLADEITRHRRKPRLVNL